MELPRGVNMSVPDLSAFAPRPKLKDPIATKVNPGDRVLVLLPQQASAQDVGQITNYLKQWAPDASFLVLAGPESVTVFPAPHQESSIQDYDIVPAAPVADSEPQGPDAHQHRASCHGPIGELQCGY